MQFLYYKCKAFSVQSLIMDLIHEKAALQAEVKVIVDYEEEERKRREAERRKRVR